MSYKLTYVHEKDSCDVIRMLFMMGEIEFEDGRLECDAWEDLKEDSVFGKAPELDFDGFRMCRVNVIERYVARKLGFFGGNDEHHALIDMILDMMSDMMRKLKLWRKLDDGDDRKLAKLEKFRDISLPRFFLKLDRLLPDGAAFFLGDDLSLADIAFVHYMGRLLDAFGIEFDWDAQPRLLGLKLAVLEHPRLAAWYALTN